MLAIGWPLAGSFGYFRLIVGCFLLRDSFFLFAPSRLFYIVVLALLFVLPFEFEFCYIARTMYLSIGIVTGSIYLR